jgi:hypothetical protein
VRGPGALVDCYNPGSTSRTTRPGGTTGFGLPVRNTGELARTITVRPTLPAGWSASPPFVTLTLAPQAEQVAAFQVLAASNATVTGNSVRFTATSNVAGEPSSSCDVPFNVVLDRTAVRSVGSSSTPWGRPAGFAAEVTDIDQGGSYARGVPVTFRLLNSGRTAVFETSGITDNLGVARSSASLPQLAPGNHRLVIETRRSGPHAPATVEVPFVVRRHATRLTMVSTNRGTYSDPVQVSARLDDLSAGVAMASRSVRLHLGSQQNVGTSDAAGLASGPIVIHQPAGPVTATASFVGDTWYESTSAPGQAFTIDKETITGIEFVGQVLGEAGDTLTVAAIGEQQDDGSDGELRRGSLRFELSGVFGNWTTAEAPMDSTGKAEAALIGLPADVYDMTAAVPSNNVWWTGAGGGHKEVIVYDPERSGSGSGAFGDGKQREFTFDARYRDGEAQGRVAYSGTDGSFALTSFDWFVSIGDRAILQAQGTFGGEPAVLRAVVTDSITGDTVSLLITTPTGTFSEPVSILASGDIELR